MLLLRRTGSVGSFSAIATPASATNVSTPGTISCGPFTAIPSGGTAPYTYLWSRVSGDTTNTATSATTAATDINATLNSSNEATSSAWRCKVTDSTAAFVFTNIIYANFRTTGS